MVALFNQQSEMVSSILDDKLTAKIKAAEGGIAVITIPHPLPNGGQTHEPGTVRQLSELIAIIQNLWLSKDKHVFIYCTISYNGCTESC
jgi:hypothetical protein